MPDEKIVQIESMIIKGLDQPDMIALTNHGRLFYYSGNARVWEDFELPPLKKAKSRSQANGSEYTPDFNDLWNQKYL